MMTVAMRTPLMSLNILKLLEFLPKEIKDSLINLK